MPSFLDKIMDVKRAEIDALYKEKQWADKVQHHHIPVPDNPFKGRFYSALASQHLSLIAEIKKASPSKGVIRQDFNPIELAKSFEKAGAKALSVLTETQYFQGHPTYIQDVKQHVSLPVLRKDFLVDPIQIYESKTLHADAILLIKALLTQKDCHDLMTLAHHLEMDVLVEVHNQDELQEVLEIKAPIIGINNRNLSTFDVDLKTTETLAAHIKEKSPQTLIVAESGYSKAEELSVLQQNGLHAVLIGEGLAKHPDLLQFFHTVI